MEKLAAHIKAANVTKSDFARSLGISAPYLSQILGGIRRPSLDVALRIASVTNGEVPVDAWGGQVVAPLRSGPLACAEDHALGGAKSQPGRRVRS